MAEVSPVKLPSDESPWVFYFMHDPNFPKCSTTFPWCMINAPVVFAWCTIDTPAAFAWCLFGTRTSASMTCRIMYRLEWQTVYALTRWLFWCLLINTKITLKWAHKQFVMWVHTLSYFLHDNRSINDNKITSHMTHQTCVHLDQPTFCWWHHNQLLMTDNYDMSMWKVIFDSLDIDFIYRDIHNQSCKKMIYTRWCISQSQI